MPRTVAEVIRLLRNPVTNPHHAQLVFTSHDTSLLGNVLTEAPLLERDQIWFVDKDPEGASALYPLTDFHPRKLENLERGYLQGRYGAAPSADLTTNWPDIPSTSGVDEAAASSGNEGWT